MFYFTLQVYLTLDITSFGMGASILKMSPDLQPNPESPKVKEKYPK